MKDWMLYGAVWGFVGGVLLRSFVDFGVSFSLFFVFLGLAVFLVNWFFRPPLLIRRAESKVGGTLLLALFLFSFGAGMLRYDFSERAPSRAILLPYLGEAVSLEGVISDEPDEREKVTRLTFRAKEFLRDGKKQSVSVLLLLTADSEPRFEYGDRVEVRGILARPKPFNDETTGREIDYPAHLAKDNIYFEMFRPRITLLAHGGGNPIVETLFASKRAFIGNINRVIPEPHAALLAGLVVGAKQSLGVRILDEFRRVGVIHIVVLSGYNITIIAYFIEWLCSRLKRNLRFILASVGIILFAVMVGASATVVRATLMALLVILARSTGRLYAVTRALLLAGLLMLLHNPKILVFDTSFQLSFLSTVGLIFLSPLIEPRVKWVTEKWKLREVVVATVSTQLFVLPFLLYQTGMVSIVSLPVNLLILSAIPMTMLFGFLSGMAGFLGALFALPFAWIAYGFLSYELFVVHWFSGLPFAAVSVPSFPFWLALLWYAGYALLIQRMNRTFAL